MSLVQECRRRGDFGNGSLGTDVPEQKSPAVRAGQSQDGS